MNPFVKILSLSLIITLTSSLVFSQDLKLDWVRTAGASNLIVVGDAVDVDKNGNVFTTGEYRGSVDFDPGPNSYFLTSSKYKFSRSTFIQKLDSNGNFVWAKSFTPLDTTKSVFNYDVTVDIRGDVYVRGRFGEMVDFDPGPGTYFLQGTIQKHHYLVKLSNDGNLIWAKRDSYGGFSIITNETKELYILGYDSLIKLDSNGVFLWGIENTIGAGSMSTDSAGNIALTGVIIDTVDVDPGPGVFLLSNPYKFGVGLAVVKYDNGGNLLWAKAAPSSDRTYGMSINFDFSGNLLIAGNLDDQLGVDFDPGPGTFVMKGDSIGFILKLNPSGDFLWAVKIRHHSYAYSSASNINSDQYGNVFAMGAVSAGIHDMDPGQDSIFDTIISHQTTYILKLDSNSNYLGHDIFFYRASDGGHNLIFDKNLNIYVTGRYSKQYLITHTDFDPSPLTYAYSSVGNTDAFVQKLSQCTYNISHDTNTVIACNSFTWIDSLTYVNDTSNITFLTGINCDFTYHHLNLKLVEADMDISLLAGTNTLEAEESNASYQWLDCNNAYKPIPNATAQTFSPSQNSNYAVEIRKNGCVDTSACISILAAGIPSFGNEINASIYPNPTSGSISIDLKGQKNIAIRITDINGRLHYQTNSFNEKVLTISTDFAPGLYFVEMSGENGIQREKLVVR